LVDLFSGSGRKRTVSKKQSPLKDLFNAVPLSEPLKTFKSNVEAIDALARMSSRAIERAKGEVEKWQTEDTQFKEDGERSLQESKGRLKRLYELRRRWMRPLKRLPTGEKGQLDEQENRLNELIRTQRALITKEKGLINRWDSSCRNYSALLDRYDKQSEILMPMVFVYLVAIWDAFVLDTVRRILKSHPHLISTADDKIEVSKSFLWNATSEEIRDYLIEQKVRQLGDHPQQLVESFKDYSGINWEASTISLNDVIEIRARRDIWVHNKGVINQQYLNMVGKDASLELGQVAEIDTQYLAQSLRKLTTLAIYIHNIAHKKHYAGTDCP
jgi:hypothetical protein